MLSDDLAQAFAAEWVAAWNAHDLERILSHWSDECVFRSPLIVRLMGDDSGAVVGKDALRAYWRKGLDNAPNLHFSFEAVLVGTDSLVITYVNHRAQRCGEWLRLDEHGKAVEGRAHYAPF